MNVEDESILSRSTSSRSSVTVSADDKILQDTLSKLNVENEIKSGELVVVEEKGGKQLLSLLGLNLGR